MSSQDTTDAVWAVEWPDVAPDWGNQEAPEAPAELGWDDIRPWDEQVENEWEWEAAGDDTIRSDDPYREEKIRWRVDHGHVQGFTYRVRRWQDDFPADIFSTREDVLNGLIRPSDEELRAIRRMRLKSRSRSRSKGRQGRDHRHRKVVEWNERGKELVVRPPSDDGLAGSTCNEELGASRGTDGLHPASVILTRRRPGSSQTRAPSDQLLEWLDSLTKKGNYRNYRHVEKAKALEFFEVSGAPLLYRRST